MLLSVYQRAKLVKTSYAAKLFKHFMLGRRFVYIDGGLIKIGPTT